MGLGYIGLRQGLSSKAPLPPRNFRGQCVWDCRVQRGGLSEPAPIRELPSQALFLSLSTEGPGVQGALVSSLSLPSSMGGGANELAFDKGAAGSAEPWI